MNEDGNITVYPKQYAGYILWGMLWIILCIVFLVLFAKSGDLGAMWNEARILAVLFLLYASIYPLIVLLTIIQLIRNQIYIQYSEDSILFKGLFLKRSAEIKDIYSITKSPYKNLLGYVFIKRKRNYFVSILMDIRLPMIWFDETEIYDMFEFLRYHNRKIQTKGIYVQVYNYTSSKKKKK